jgi:hypothetical protein
LRYTLSFGFTAAQLCNRQWVADFGRSFHSFLCRQAADTLAA